MKSLLELPAGNIKALAALQKKKTTSRSQLIREAVERYLKQETVLVEADVLGIWKDGEQNGLKVQQNLRNE